MRIAVFLLMCAGIVASMLVPPAVGFLKPDLARLIFFHLPCALVTPLYMIWSGYTGARFLMSRERHWDFRCSASNDMTTAMAVATMATGILFSKAQWGEWWSWDLRQTSFLIVLLLLGAYYALRMAFDDEILRARASAAYSALSLAPMLFLIFVFPNLPQVIKGSNHPNGVLVKGAMSSDYKAVFFSIAAVLFAYSAILYRQRVKALLLEERAKAIEDGSLENGGDGPTAYRVDRSVSV